MRELIWRLREAGFADGQLYEREPMSRHTTMKVGGPADLLVEPDGEAQLLAALEIARGMGVPVLTLCGGSNLIVRDGGVRGLTVKLADRFARLEKRDNRIHAQAGARLKAVALLAQREGLSGFEFAAGIPGSVGGAVLMNAGAYGGEIVDVLISGRVLSGGIVTEYDNRGFEFSYRNSRVMREGGVVLSAVFELKPGDPEAIKERMRDLAERRRDKQPLHLPSAGSTFKRPEGHYAAALIEQAGLKGLAVGGAMVSTKHAGFVVNAGGATARDVIELIELVREKVHAHSGVLLTPEVRIVGED